MVEFVVFKKSLKKKSCFCFVFNFKFTSFFLDLLLLLREAALGPGEPPFFCFVYSKVFCFKLHAFYHCFCQWKQAFLNIVGLAEIFSVTYLACSQFILCKGCHWVCCFFPPLKLISYLQLEMCPKVLWI